MLKVLENGTAPTKATKHSAAVDLYASEDVTIGAGETKLVEIKMIIHNPIKTSAGGHSLALANRYGIKKGDKIAQILLKEHKTYLLGIESERECTGGLGSTGK